MKYLYLKADNRENAKYDMIVPVDATLSIEWFHDVPYLSCGGKLLVDVDKNNETALIPFLANAFNNVDVVTINLTNGAPTAQPTVKRGLEP